jgi:NADH-quinone oxidoreductase subunit G
VLDAANPAAAADALRGAGMVVALTSFRDAAADVADVMLPIAPFTETSGTFVNAEGRVQGFHGVVKPLGETRPAWKVLRVLGNLLGLPGFAQESSEEVRAEALGDVATLPARLSNRSGAAVEFAAAPAGLERLADVRIYATDALVRRAASLQMTADAVLPFVGISSAVWERLALRPAQRVRLRQGLREVALPVRLDASLPANVVRVSAGQADTAGLGPMFGPIEVEVA